jgi:hypothetical protein
MVSPKIECHLSNDSGPYERADTVSSAMDLDNKVHSQSDLVASWNSRRDSLRPSELCRPVSQGKQGNVEKRLQNLSRLVCMFAHHHHDTISTPIPPSTSAPSQRKQQKCCTFTSTSHFVDEHRPPSVNGHHQASHQNQPSSPPLLIFRHLPYLHATSTNV